MLKKIQSLLDLKVYRFMTLTLAGMVLSLLVDMLVFKKFGAGTIADLYVLINTIPLILEGIIREGTRTALVPVFAECRSQKGGDRQISAVINLSVLAGFIVMIVLWSSTGSLAQALASEQMRHEHYELLESCLGLLLLIIPLGIVGAVLAAMLVLCGENGALAQRNIIPPMFAMAVIASQGDVTIAGVTKGTVAGYAAYILFLVYKLRGKNFAYAVDVLPDRQLLDRLLGAVTWTVLSMVIGQGGRLVERLVLTRLGVGLLAKYYMAFRIVAAIQTLVGHSFAVVGINRLVRENTVAMLLRNVKAGFVLAAAATLIIEVFAKEIIMLLFGGEGMSTVAINEVTTILRILGVGLVCQCLIPILELPFYTDKKTWLVTINALLMFVLKLLLLLALARMLMAEGVAIAATVAAIAGCVLPVMYVYRLKNRKNDG
jgi:peptidoglycan biosynthesis protein MviN/MurJ (putative lipid II flippase)